MKAAFGVIAIAMACAPARDAAPHRAPATPIARMTAIAPGVSLEVVDWGGRGPPLVFLAGLGSTAHLFDEFAPQFTDSFHVVGITRRGFGASAGMLPPTEIDTLVADITAVLDTLGFDAVTLVGHSIAGEEMTRFAELHGARCANLVYLDAAYDRAGVDTLSQPPTPEPRISAADTASFESITALYARVLGVRQPESETRAMSLFDSGDRYRGQVTADSLKSRIASGTRVARYDRSRCRALAIYAVPDSIADVVPYYAELDSTGLAQSKALLEFVRSYVAASRAKFARFPRNQIVDIHGGNHLIFLQRPTEVARAMRAFLASAAR